MLENIFGIHSGHANKSTTEIYVKQRWKEAVEMNKVKISNGVEN